MRASPHECYARVMLGGGSLRGFSPFFLGMGMSNWETWPYLCDLDLLHRYEPQSEVVIFKKGSDTSVKRKFKEWRGIVSHLYDYVKDGGSASIAVFFGDDAVIVDAMNDRNPTVQCYPFDDIVKWRQL